MNIPWAWLLGVVLAKALPIPKSENTKKGTTTATRHDLSSNNKLLESNKSTKYQVLSPTALEAP